MADATISYGAQGALADANQPGLLARIHRYTLDRLRREVEPVSVAEYMRFLLAWHHVDADHRMEGVAALAIVIFFARQRPVISAT